MTRPKQTVFILSQNDPNVTRKISRGNFLAAFVFWAREGEGLGLLRYIGYQRCVRPQRVRFLSFLCLKKV